jgi:hypothetical protein
MASQTIHVKITLKIPLENHLIEDLTLRLKEVHREIVLVSTDPASGAVFFNCPASDQHYLNALGDLFDHWIRDGTPQVLTYNLVRE